MAVLSFMYQSSDSSVGNWSPLLMHHQRTAQRNTDLITYTSNQSMHLIAQEFF